MTRSRLLVESCAGTLGRALEMRFVTEVRTGTIGDQAYADYLAIEASFVETAARLYGLAIWDAPGWAAIQRTTEALHALTTEQADYFAAARAAWPVPARLDDDAARRAGGLSRFAMEAAGEGGRPAVMTVLFAAETLYLTWCARARSEGRVPPGPIADWVTLHTTASFRAGVEALASEVDRVPASISDERLASWFTGTLDAEVAFHDAVYAP